MFRRSILGVACLAAFAGVPGVCAAQIVESVGERALGMGGAFVAVASDSSATWWNPAGLATGPFGDITLARAVVDRQEGPPAGRDRASWFAATVPAIGLSYYHLRITNIRRPGTTERPAASRQETLDSVSRLSFAATQWGLTVVQSILPGIHAGATLKYVRGTVRADGADGSQSMDELLDRGEALGGGDGESRFDLDAGLVGVAGPLRVGAVMRNIRASRFGQGAFALPRQTRVGVALDVAQVGGPPFALAVDADARRYSTPLGERRVVALGAEQWLGAHRVGLRGGGRVNTVGERERVAAAGASLLVRAGLYVEGHVTGSKARAERGWGVGARVTF